MAWYAPMVPCCRARIHLKDDFLCDLVDDGYWGSKVLTARCPKCDAEVFMLLSADMRKLVIREATDELKKLADERNRAVKAFYEAVKKW